MKNKGLAALIVGGLPKEKSEDSSDSEDMGDEDAMSDEEIAADDFITAVKEDDPAALVDAFKNLMECCGYGKKEEISEGEDQ